VLSCYNFSEIARVTVSYPCPSSCFLVFRVVSRLIILLELVKSHESLELLLIVKSHVYAMTTIKNISKKGIGEEEQ